MAAIVYQTEEAGPVRDTAEKRSSSSSRGLDSRRPWRCAQPVGFLTKMLLVEFFQAVKKLGVIY